MTASTGVNLGIESGYDPGVAGWGAALNRALRTVDAMVFGMTRAAPQAAPPGAPVKGDTYIVAATGASGAWTGHGNKVAVWVELENLSFTWQFHVPRDGWKIIRVPSNAALATTQYVFRGGVWVRGVGGRLWANVKDFGAVGDGVADDTTAIQAAFDSLSGVTPYGSTGGTAYFPLGTYSVTGITLKPGQSVEADDPRQATVVARADNTNLFSYTATATVSGFSFRRLGLQGGGFAGVRGIKLDGTDSAKRIVHVHLDDIYAAFCARAVDLKFCAASRLENVKSEVCGVGLYLDQCSDTDVVGGWSQNGSDWGLLVNGGPGAFDEGMRVVGFSTNVQSRGVSVTGQEWGNLTGCSFTSAKDGPAVFNGASGWKISDCDFSTGGLVDVTFQTAGNTVTLTAHGRANGSAVSFTSIVTTTGISISTTYVVLGATANTFQLATVAAPTVVIDLTGANGTGTLARTVGFTCDATTHGLQITNSFFALNTFGLTLLGSGHVIVGNRFQLNTAPDINLQATTTVVANNHCESVGYVASIVEQSGSNYNNITGNIVNGTVVIVGANSAQANNVIY